MKGATLRTLRQLRSVVAQRHRQPRSAAASASGRSEQAHEERAPRARLVFERPVGGLAASAAHPVPSPDRHTSDLNFCIFGVRAGQAYRFLLHWPVLSWSDSQRHERVFSIVDSMIPYMVNIARAFWVSQVHAKKGQRLAGWVSTVWRPVAVAISRVSSKSQFHQSLRHYDDNGAP